MRVLLTGASGQLGAYLLRELRERDEEVIAWTGSRTGALFGVPLRPVDLANTDGVASAFAEARPERIIHAAGLTTIAACHREPAQAEQVNTRATVLLAELSGRSRASLLFISTDLVFDGERGWYRETDSPSPLSVYGRTKAAAEQAVLAHPAGAVVRVSLLFGPGLAGRRTFFDEQAAALREGRPCTLFEDEWRTPLGLLPAARALLAVAASDYRGLLHLGGPERLSRLEMGRRLAAFLGCDPSSLVPATRASAASPEPRPRDTSLDSSLWRTLFPCQEWPGWDEALEQMMRQSTDRTRSTGQQPRVCGPDCRQ
jgi:dTDP-4-dehydrorhamnose reductase